MHKQVLISVKDIRFATLFCRHCHTRVTLDCDVELDSPGRSPFLVPRECPRCNNPFDSALPAAVTAIQKVYKAVVALGDALTFHGDPAGWPEQ